MPVDPVATRHHFRSLHRLVGNTPLLAVQFTWRGEPRVIYAKQEPLNFTGSIKDRMALYVLECAYHDGHIRPGDRIVEATSGNTGISFAAIGRTLGHPVTIRRKWRRAIRASSCRSSSRTRRNVQARRRDDWTGNLDAARAPTCSGPIRSRTTHLSRHVEITGLNAFGRVCAMCIDPPAPAAPIRLRS